MAEISEISEDNLRNESRNQPDFDPETMRKTGPGLKRLILTISVLFSFLIGIRTNFVIKFSRFDVLFTGFVNIK